MSFRTAALRMVEILRFRLLTTRYLVDRPRALYQPLPFLGITKAKRSAGTESRLDAIVEELESIGIRRGVVVDHGCNVGYFALSLCRRGFSAYGVERDEYALSIASTAARLIGVPFSPVHSGLTPDNVHEAPGGDVTICLSLWHHWVREFGMESATAMLKCIFGATRRVLFFDSGEAEMSGEYGLEFGDTPPRVWFERYFAEHLHPVRIDWLGTHAAFGPRNSREAQGQVQRNLFAIVKD